MVSMAKGNIDTKERLYLKKIKKKDGETKEREYIYIQKKARKKRLAELKRKGNKRDLGG